VAWRRDFHQHPELGYQETRSAGVIADHLRKLGMEVRTGVAKTGVVGILRGGKSGRVVALRADMDALPVTEELDVPFASKVRARWGGQQVGVMHTCGHDAHMAMRMGVANRRQVSCNACMPTSSISDRFVPAATRLARCG
jgi:amidohydrolase